MNAWRHINKETCWHVGFPTSTHLVFTHTFTHHYHTIILWIFLLYIFSQLPSSVFILEKFHSFVVIFSLSVAHTWQWQRHWTAFLVYNMRDNTSGHTKHAVHLILQLSGRHWQNRLLLGDKNNPLHSSPLVLSFLFLPSLFPSSFLPLFIISRFKATGLLDEWNPDCQRLDRTSDPLCFY